jgi:hypothetical protein
MPDSATLKRLVARAVQAPSSHNTQPWLFRLGDGRAELLADRRRALPVNDPDDRELTISCGCALMTLRVATAAAGLGEETTLLPDPGDEDLLARVVFGGPPDSALARLAPAIDGRHTLRAGFADRAVTPDDRGELVDAATSEGAWFVPLDGEETRAEAVSLVADGDAALWQNPSWRRELAQWMHPRRQGDGITLPWLTLPAARLVVRSFDMGGGVAAHDSQLADGSPLLAVLGTPGDTPRDWLVAGQALQRLLLRGVGSGLQASYLNQPAQVAALRPRLAALTGRDGAPQTLLRMGYSAEALAPAPRRPVADVLLGADG